MQYVLRKMNMSSYTIVSVVTSPCPYETNLLVLSSTSTAFKVNIKFTETCFFLVKFHAPLSFQLRTSDIWFQFLILRLIVEPLAVFLSQRFRMKAVLRT